MQQGYGESEPEPGEAGSVGERSRRRGPRGRGEGPMPAPAHSHGHGHGHGPAAPASARLRKVIAAVLIPFATAVLAGIVLLWPGGVPPHKPTGVGFDRQTASGQVTKVEKLPCEKVNVGPGNTLGQPPAGGGSGAGPGGTAAASGTCERATVKVTSGKDRGRTFPEVVRPDQLRRYSPGQEVVLAYAPQAPKDLRYSVLDVRRGLPMALLAAVFALAVIAIGRLRGLTALVSLVISFGVLTLFVLPAVLQGSDPLLVAVVGGSAIMLIALYLCHGLSARTSVAALGTLASLLLIGLLGSLFTAWAFLTGNTSDETGLVHSLYPDIEIRGLLLAGIVIGSLGVLDDVTVTQTSAVWELKQANPLMSARELYRAGLRIGRDHIASTVNTLVLAYAGASLPLLLLFSIAQSDVLIVAGSEVVAEEIVRTLVGSIGLVASVPVTTALAALVASTDKTKPGTPNRAGEQPEPAGTAASPGGTAPVPVTASAPHRHAGHRRRR